MWHVSNELGGHNAHCYCDVSAAAFRDWLRARYGDVDAPQRGVGHRVLEPALRLDFDEVLPPRTAPTFANPTQQLDFPRFSSDALLECFVAERDLLHRAHARASRSPPTSWSCEHVRDMDYLALGSRAGRRLQDHYLMAHDPDGARRAVVERRPHPRHRAAGGRGG